MTNANQESFKDDSNRLGAKKPKSVGLTGQLSADCGHKAGVFRRPHHHAQVVAGAFLVVTLVVPAPSTALECLDGDVCSWTIQLGRKVDIIISPAERVMTPYGVRLQELPNCEFCGSYCQEEVDYSEDIRFPQVIFSNISVVHTPGNLFDPTIGPTTDLISRHELVNIGGFNRFLIQLHPTSPIQKGTWYIPITGGNLQCWNPDGFWSRHGYTDGSIVSVTITSTPPSPPELSGPSSVHVGQAASFIASGSGVRHRWMVSGVQTDFTSPIRVDATNGQSAITLVPGNIGTLTVEAVAGSEFNEASAPATKKVEVTRPPLIVEPQVIKTPCDAETVLTGKVKYPYKNQRLRWRWTVPAALHNEITDGNVDFSSIEPEFLGESLHFLEPPFQPGVYTISCTAEEVDAEGNVLETATGTVTWTVDVIPPQIEIQGAYIPVLNSIQLESRIDPDKSPLKAPFLDRCGLPFDRVEWLLLQAPQAEGSQELQSVAHFQGDPELMDVLPGEWVIALEVENTDIPGDFARATTHVHVPGTPVARITGPHEVDLNLDSGNPLILDGTGSEAAHWPKTLFAQGEIPCSEDVCSGCEVCRCHWRADGETCVPGSDNLSFRWFIEEHPKDTLPVGMAGIEYQGPAGEVLTSIKDDGGLLVLPEEELSEGRWGFRLEVTDSDGSADLSPVFWVSVRREGFRPFVYLPPATGHVDLDGNLQAPISLTAWAFDPDVLTKWLVSGKPVPLNLGIASYHWTPLGGPAQCDPPWITPSSGPEPQTLVGFNSPISPECQAGYGVFVTAIDADIPFPHADTAWSTVSISNCEEDVCIDSPTHASPTYLPDADAAEVFVHYHVNSLLYDQSIEQPPRLQLVVSDHVSGQVIFDHAWDQHLLPFDKGGELVFHWNGYTNQGIRPEPGVFDIAIRRVVSDSVSSETREQSAIFVQTGSIEFQDSWWRLSDLADGNPAEIPFKIKDIPPSYGIEKVTWSVLLDGQEVASGSLPGSAIEPKVVWDGRDLKGALVAAGRYLLRVEAERQSKTLVSAEHWLDVVAVSISAQPALQDGLPLVLLANRDDDDVDGVSDLNNQPCSLHEDDLRLVTLDVQPKDLGTVAIDMQVLEPCIDAALQPIRLWTTPNKAVGSELPMSNGPYKMDASQVPTQVFLEGACAGKVQIDLRPETFQDGGGALTVAVVEVELIRGKSETSLPPAGSPPADKINVFKPVETDLTQEPAVGWVNISRWDNAYDRWSGELRTKPDENGQDLIDLDPTRYYGRVRDIMATDQKSVQLLLGTSFEPGAVQEPLAPLGSEPPVVQTANAADTGVFVTRSQMWTSYNLGLVDAAGNPSDDSVTTMGAPGSEVLDGQPEDRLHRAGLTSVVQARYQPEWAGGQFVSATIPVCNRNPNKPLDPNGPLDKWGRRSVTIRFFVLEEPFRDEGILDDNGQKVPGTEGNGRFDWLHRRKDGVLVLCSGPAESGQNAINPPECGSHQPGEASEPYVDLVWWQSFEMAFSVGVELDYVTGIENADGLGYGPVLRDMSILNREIQMAAAAWAPGCIGVRRIPEVVTLRTPLHMLDDGVIDTDEMLVLVDYLQPAKLDPPVGWVQEVIVATTFGNASDPTDTAVGYTVIMNYQTPQQEPPVILINASTKRGNKKWVDRGWDPTLAHELGHAFSEEVDDFKNYPWMIYPSEIACCSASDNSCTLWSSLGDEYPDGPMSENINKARRLVDDEFEKTKVGHYLNLWETK